MSTARKPPTMQQLQALAAEIEAIETRGSAQTAARAGRKILDRVYYGDVTAFQSKDSNKGASLLTLAALLHRSVTRVWALVAVAIVYEDLPSDLRDRLSASHLEVLYGAPDIERERLARESVAAGHTSAELAARVKGAILPDPPPPLDRSPIGRAERSVAVVVRAALAAPPEQHPDLKRRIQEMITQLEGARDGLDAADRG